MTEDEMREGFHRIELRMERFEVRLDALDKRVSDGFAQINTRLEGMENRLNTKAGNWTVSLWGATLAIIMAAFKLLG